MGVMGAGIALEFKKRHPKMYTDYVSICTRETEKFRLGSVALWKNKEFPQTLPAFIWLFPTKFHWKERSSLSAIEDGLKMFLYMLEKTDIQSVAFPKIGCGLGGLNFEDEVKPLLHHYLDPINHLIEVYC